MTLGTATNPPIANTAQRLTAPVTGARAAIAPGSGRKGKPVAYGAGRTKVRSGKTVALRVRLNGRARARLRKNGKLKATLTVVSTTTAGERRTTIRSVKIKPEKRKKRG